ncbi:putative ribonuclease H-like domain-containing protein [Tanacetum coccineum]
MDQDSAYMVAAFKVLMLKPGEYEIWRMRIEQYIQMIDYALWEVLENGATLPKITTVEGVVTVMPITTTEEKAQRRLEVKVRSTLMMGIPNEHQLKFNSINDAKKLLEAVEKIFGGNAATKKTQRNLLKQQYENFTAPSSEMLDQTFDRLQNLWNTHAVVWRNKANLETMSMDDLYNNLKVYKPEVKGMSSSSLITQNMDFVSSSNNNTSSTNEAVNTANEVSTASTQVNATYSINIDNLSDVFIYDMKEMDLRWQMAMLTMRARRFLKNIGRKLTVNGNETISFDKSKVECYNFYKRGHFARKCRALRNQDNKNKESSRRSVHVEISTSTALVSYDGLGGYDWNKFDHASKSLNKLIESQIVDNSKKGLGYENYNAVPPPYTGNFMPPTPDLSFIGLDEFVNEPVVENYKAMSSKEERKVVRKNDDALIIEEWVSDDEEEDVSQPKTKKKTVRPGIVKKEFVKSKQQEKTARKIVKQVEQHSFDHLQVDCNYHQKRFQNQKMVKPVWNNAQRVNHQNFAKKTHPYARKNLVPRAVLMKSGLVSVNTARQVNAAHSKTTVNAARPMSYLSKTAHSTVKRPINKNTTFKNSNINQRDNTVRGKNLNTARPKAVVNVVKRNNFNVVKASACWVWKPKHKVLDHGNPQIDLQDQGVIDSGCSRHMTGNMSYLTNYEEIDGGYVAFGGNPKGGKITGKVPRKNNMYSVDLKNIVPKGGLTCLFAKATSDESKLWHRRLGHLNFKTMNKLVKGNLVRGLPSKLFENDQTYVACQKGKQHKASSTKDETSGILKSFITEIESLVDHKVKVIRCDNGTGTPHQNRVAERRNRIPIKASMTMIADSKLPTTFWAQAVNTACYVQNRVLVVKPHNKTPYELFHGRTPTLSFMRPFGCPITILNTIDHLAKFDGKANECFFVGYSLNSKAFRVFNSRTRIVEENLHIRFSKSTPNVVGSGPYWQFDIDALTRTMNYEPIVIGTQSNGFAGTKASDNAGQARKETKPVKDYILLPLWTVDPLYSQDPKSSLDDGSKPSSDYEKKVDEDPRKDSECKDQEKEDNVNSTNNVNAAGTNEVNVVGRKTSIALPFDPNMPALKDVSIFDYSRDDEDDGAAADMNNLDTTIQVSHILTIRIHKDHPLDQVTEDLKSATQTRKMSKNLEEHGRNLKRTKSNTKVSHLQLEKIVRAKKQTVVAQIPHRKLSIDAIKFGRRKYALTVNPTIYTSCIEQFWTTAVAKTVNGEVQLHALVDGKKIIVTKVTVRRDLHLEDAEGVECLRNATIFEELTRMGMVKNLDNVGKFLMYPRFVQVFLNQQLNDMSNHTRIYLAPSHTKKISGNIKRVGKGFSGRVTPLFPTMVVQNQEELGEGSAIPTDPHHTPTFIQPSPQPQKTQKPRRLKKDTQVPQSSVPSDSVADEAVYKELDVSLVRASTTASSLETEQDNGNIIKTQSKVTPNEAGSQGTASGGGPRRQETMGDTIAHIRSENVSKLSNDPLLARGDEESLGEDASKQGRRIDDIDVDETITLTGHDDEIFDMDTLNDEEMNVAEQEVAAKDVDLTVNEVTLAQSLAALKRVKPKFKGIVIQKPGTTTTTKIISSQQSQDKGKGILVEPKSKRKEEQTTNSSSTKKNHVYLPEEYGRKEAFRLEEQIF